MSSHTHFASDNNSTVHPAVMQALAQANTGHADAYGWDPLSLEVEGLFRQHFGEQARTYLTYNGTATNVLALKLVTQSWQQVVCSSVAHIHTDECGAPEAHGGFKLLPIPAPDGKLGPELLMPALLARGIEHRNQSRVVSITQPTEYGTLYTIDEVKALADFCHGNDLLLHMDGARLANAAAALGVPLRAFTTDAGVDLLSFGGTKNGLMMAEAVVVLNPDLPADDLRYWRKQGMQLASKHRYLAAQFQAYLSDELYRSCAEHANAMAQRFADQTKGLPSLEVTQEIQTNMVFAKLPTRPMNQLMRQYQFYAWDPLTNEVRWAFAWDTPPEAVDAFALAVRQALEANHQPA